MPIDASRIQKSVRKLRKRLKRPQRRPLSRHVHSLRTNCRRFESTVHALGLDSGSRFLYQLARVRKRAGKVRDMDVLIGFALTAPVAGEQDCLVQLLEYLGARRAKQARKLRALIADSGPALRRWLKRRAAELESAVEPVRTHREESAIASTEAMSTALHLSAALTEPRHLDRTNLHAYRLKVKELQYVLELASNSEQQELVARLKAVKDAIGDWHDWEGLAGIAGEVLNHGPRCKLLAKLRAACEARYAHALALANRLRREFVAARSPQVRGGGRRRPRTSPVPVLAATSALSA